MSCLILRKATTVLGGLVLSTLAIACTSAGPTDMDTCNGAKCDDPVGTPTAHAAAVLECDRQLVEGLSAVGASLEEEIKVQRYFAECLVSADNGSIATIEGNLQTLEAPRRSREEIFIVFDEFRYASLCVDIESASAEQGDALELLGATCASSRERSLADVIGAFVDFDGKPSSWSLVENRENFAECYQIYDEQLALSETPTMEYVARQSLVACATDTLRGQALPLKEALCEQEVCSDELVTLLFVEAGFETAIATSDRMCQMLIDSSVYRRDDAAEQLLNCRMAIYSELATQVAKGLQ